MSIPTAGASAPKGPSMLPAVAAIAGDLIGGIMASRGQKQANKMNLRIAQDNRDFQERMSSTAYQRSAKDLEAAGLNRILALGNAASSPSGAMTTMQNEKKAIGSSISKAAHSAMALTLQAKQAANIAQQTKLVNAQTTNTTNLGVPLAIKAKVLHDFESGALDPATSIGKSLINQAGQWLKGAVNPYLPQPPR